MLTSMLAVGVDLSAEEPKTWMASIELLPFGAIVVSLDAHVSNKQIVAAAARADVVGIDCPLGWPDDFLTFVNEHRQGNVTRRTGEPIKWRQRLAYRETDRFVIKQFKDTIKLRPLSVATDRIAHVAMRCAALLADFQRDGVVVDRSGMTGKVFEVYPAASLARWDLPHRGYKRVANESQLKGLVTNLRAKAPWLDLGDHEHDCRTNDDAFDAVIAALSAATAKRGLTTPPPRNAVELAKREGWIAVPHVGSLSRLVKDAM